MPSSAKEANEKVDFEQREHVRDEFAATGEVMCDFGDGIEPGQSSATPVTTAEPFSLSADQAEPLQLAAAPACIGGGATAALQLAAPVVGAPTAAAASSAAA